MDKRRIFRTCIGCCYGTNGVASAAAKRTRGLVMSTNCRWSLPSNGILFRSEEPSLCYYRSETARSLATSTAEADSTATSDTSQPINGQHQSHHSEQASTTMEENSSSSWSSYKSSWISDSASPETKAALNSIHHFVAGGTPFDPVPPPFNLAPRGEDSLYTLVLLRHGESEWNSQNRYTGWCDVNLTKKGEMEARTAGRLLRENSVEVDQAFTSVLKRASFSCNMALNTAGQHWVPVTKTWRLNERHYGALQGYPKDDAWKELGLDQELVMQMRRSYDVRPPRMEDSHDFWHGSDRRYRKLTNEQLERSRTESLKDAAGRIMPFFDSVVVPSLRAGNKCIIVSHANTIRTLVKQIDQISDEDIKSLTIPTGIPILYRLDKNMRPVDPQSDLEFRYGVEPKGYMWDYTREHGFRGVYLGDIERLQEIQKKRDSTNRAWQRIILRNIGKSLGWDMDANDTMSFGGLAPPVKETRQIWWQIRTKMQSQDYSNMLLLVKMEQELERLMHDNKQKYITKRQYEKFIDFLHLDVEGQVVKPFVALNDRQQRAKSQRLWYDSLALDLEEDLEEECLIK